MRPPASCKIPPIGYAQVRPNRGLCTWRVKMKRREFCRTSVAASFAAAYPFLAGCGREAPVAATAEQPKPELPRFRWTAIPSNWKGRPSGNWARPARARSCSPASPGYDSARKVWNGMHDKHPALIARCLKEGDVQNAVTFARERNLLVAVRGGGHSWPGKSVCEGGMMLDLALMNTATVDPVRSSALGAGRRAARPPRHRQPWRRAWSPLPASCRTPAWAASRWAAVSAGSTASMAWRWTTCWPRTSSRRTASCAPSAPSRNPTCSGPSAAAAEISASSRAFEFQLHPFDRNVLSGHDRLAGGAGPRGAGFLQRLVSRACPTTCTSARPC